MTESDKDKNKVEPTLEPLLQAHIGKQLRTMYDAMTREPVPERFKLLLDQLEAGEVPQGQVSDHAKAGADKAGAA
ncbi:NepR family anti-sigma factor [Rhodoblastus sp.]|jgi:hypothetical protein|uniref:NepR family anti-sigma factor n=1 Tax=Rhodoblastus sp. TaxID=1962975 RepID=UPI0026144C1E|nr:NepR family anti-sigma factor [Rhodoblastus sp.]